MNKTKKILFISSSQHFVDIFLKDLIISLSEEFNVSLITNFENELIYKKYIETIHLPVKRKTSLLSDLLVSIIFIIKFFKLLPERLISVTPKSLIFGIIAKILKPNVYRIHIYTGFTWTNMKGIRKNFFILLDKINIFFSDKVLFDSQNQIDYLINKNFNSKKFHLISNGSIKGVDLNTFYKFNSSQKKLLYAKYRIPDNFMILLYMGRMDPDKGIYELIESFKIVTKSLNNVFLVLVGKDEMEIANYLSKLDENIKNKILYLDHVSKPEEIYNLSDVYCLPSKREGFGMAIIESCACQVPVIGSNIFGLRSSVINNYNGLLFKVDDVEDLALKIKKLFKDRNLREFLGKNGREFVKKNFNNNEVLNSFKNLIIK